MYFFCNVLFPGWASLLEHYQKNVHSLSIGRDHTDSARGSGYDSGFNG